MRPNKRERERDEEREKRKPQHPSTKRHIGAIIHLYTSKL